MEIVLLGVKGFKEAIHGMRNPLNSWDKADSYISEFTNDKKEGFVFGKNDLYLAKRLANAGNEHGKFLRMIHVYADIDMPRYWWSEFDTYKFNTKNSCSTMHKLLNNDNEITKDLFVYCEEDLDIVEIVVERIESLRKQFKAEKNNEVKERYLLRAKRLLIEGFLQLRTVDTNYAELRNAYHQRKHHRLKEEWIDLFCKFVESLPYASELILGMSTEE